jgi:predicted GIY-YIG superfamily endonuclease
MDAGFREYVESLHAAFERLTTMKPVSATNLPKLLPHECVYLFSENGRALYVGRTRKLRQRIRNHCGSASGHNQAVFAFRLVREQTGMVKASYSSETSREALLRNTEFAALFGQAKTRISRMDLRYVEEPDPLRQALLEIYASFVLKTPYNDFDTH